MEIVDVKKLSGSKFLSFYDILLKDPKTNTTSHYYFSSRHGDESELECLTGKQNVDTVCIVPKFYDESGDLCYIIIDEMRYPVGDVCYSFPAGLVDDGEVKVSAALRELEEETGIKITENLVPVGDVTYNSEGMTDETVQMFEVLIGSLNLGEQKLKDLEERIGLHFVKAKDAEEFMKGKKFSTKAALFLRLDSKLEMEKSMTALTFEQLKAVGDAEYSAYLENRSLQERLSAAEEMLAAYQEQIEALQTENAKLEEQKKELETMLGKIGGSNQPQ